jgi:serine/threonine protein kinase
LNSVLFGHGDQDPSDSYDQQTFERKELENEAFILQVLTGHPNIVEYHGSYIVDRSNIFFFAMELIDGFNLEQLKTKTSIFSLQKTYDSEEEGQQAAGNLEKLISRVCADILSALGKMQNVFIDGELCKIAHRDLKLENLIVDVSAARPVAKKMEDIEMEDIQRTVMIDFGYGIVLKEGERCNQRIGTDDYMSPEVSKCPILDDDSSPDEDSGSSGSSSSSSSSGGFRVFGSDAKAEVQESSGSSSSSSSSNSSDAKAEVQESFSYDERCDIWSMGMIALSLFNQKPFSEGRRGQNNRSLNIEQYLSYLAEWTINRKSEEIKKLLADKDFMKKLIDWSDAKPVSDQLKIESPPGASDDVEEILMPFLSKKLSDIPHLVPSKKLMIFLLKTLSPESERASVSDLFSDEFIRIEVPLGGINGLDRGSGAFDQ